MCKGVCLTMLKKKWLPTWECGYMRGVGGWKEVKLMQFNFNWKHLKMTYNKMIYNFKYKCLKWDKNFLLI